MRMRDGSSDGGSSDLTQGLHDMLTLRRAKSADFSALKVLVVGDLRHSRVARSDLQALRTLGAGEVRACGPRTLLPEDATLAGCTVLRDFDAALEGVDAEMMLRQIGRARGRESRWQSVSGAVCAGSLHKK